MQPALAQSSGMQNRQETTSLPLVRLGNTTHHDKWSTTSPIQVVYYFWSSTLEQLNHAMEIHHEHITVSPHHVISPLSRHYKKMIYTVINKCQTPGARCRLTPNPNLAYNRVLLGIDTINYPSPRTNTHLPNVLHQPKCNFHISPTPS